MCEIRFENFYNDCVECRIEISRFTALEDQIHTPPQSKSIIVKLVNTHLELGTTLKQKMFMFAPLYTVIRCKYRQNEPHYCTSDSERHVSGREHDAKRAKLSTSP